MDKSLRHRDVPLGESVAALFGMFVGAFLVSLLLAALWLIAAMLIPPLRKRPTLTHAIAMAVAVIAQFLNMGGPTVHGLLAAAACCALLYWQMKRAQARLAVQS